jgi:hypothetical protein
MVSDPEVVVRLTRLTKELDTDMSALDARGREIGELIQAWATAGCLPRPELVLLAVNLHGWYTALETALERVARLLDQTVPAGNTWHVDLLAQMQVEIPGLRPCVVPSATVPELHELRKFRHFFRNAYVLDLDPTLVRQRAEALLRILQPVVDGLGGLCAHIAVAIAELTR